MADAFAKLRGDTRRYVVGLGQDVDGVESMTQDEVGTLRALEAGQEFPVDEYRLSSR